MGALLKGAAAGVLLPTFSLDVRPLRVGRRLLAEHDVCEIPEGTCVVVEVGRMVGNGMVRGCGSFEFWIWVFAEQLPVIFSVAHVSAEVGDSLEFLGVASEGAIEAKVLNHVAWVSR